GAASYNGIVEIHASSNDVYVKVNVPFMRPLSIPADEIAGCSMTCFGPSDQHVDLLIPRTGTDIEIPSSHELLDWCWNNRKPMMSSNVLRDWQYKKTPLPSATGYRDQLDSRQLFDRQTKMSCAGY